MASATQTNAFEGKHVVVLINTLNTVKNFRLPLFKALKRRNCRVTVISTEKDNFGLAKELGIEILTCPMPNRSTNPFKNLRYSHLIGKMLEALRPDVIMCFQLLINIFGSFGARRYLKLNKKCVLITTAEGLGEAFVFKTLKWRLLRIIISSLYKKALRLSNLVYFLNPDDQKVFVDKKIVPPSKCRVINGIGVEPSSFSPDKSFQAINVGMVARLLKLKGILDYCEIARSIHEKNKDIRFYLVGGEKEYTMKDISEYINDGSIQYLGNRNDMPDLYKRFTHIFLCSFREGCPVSIMEGMASGCIPVVNDSPGCRNLVKPEWGNGLIINTHDRNNIPLIYDFLINKTEADKRSLSNLNRSLVERLFDAEVIQNQFLDDVAQLL